MNTQLINTFDYLHSDNLEDFALNLIRHWYRVSQILDDNLFRSFLSRVIQSFTSQRNLDVFLDDNISNNDLRLLRLIYRLCPTSPRHWKEWVIQREQFADICRLTISGDTNLQQVIIEIFTLNVLGEIATITNDIALNKRSEDWTNAGNEYMVIKRQMLGSGAPENIFPTDSYALSVLYLIVCEGYSEVTINNENTGNIAILTKFAYPWLSCLDKSQPLSEAVKFLRSFILPYYENLARNNFLTTHDSVSTATVINSYRLIETGWNPPNVILQAAHIDIFMRFENHKHSIAKGLRISWSVRNAKYIYLSGFGFVSPEGTYPNRSMSRGLVYPCIDRCSCINHNENWFTLTQSQTFFLVAIDKTGISIHRLPRINVTEPTLIQQTAEYNTCQMTSDDIYTEEKFQYPMLNSTYLYPRQEFQYLILNSTYLYPRQEFQYPILDSTNLYPQTKFLDKHIQNDSNTNDRRFNIKDLINKIKEAFL